MSRHRKQTNALLFWLLTVAYAVLLVWSVVLYWWGST